MSGVAELAQCIANAVKQSKRSSGRSIQAQVCGNGVIVNGKTMPFIVGIDAPVETGDYVWVVVEQSGYRAVVVGK